MDPAAAFLQEEIDRNKIINETIEYGDSEVQRFYDDKTIFITGGSGFLGKQLIEKLLRSCNIKKIYLLIRPKKDKTINERITKMCNDPVYDVLRTMKPDFDKKIVPVLGDVEKLNIGLSEEDRNMLIEEVDVIFHVAATINFTEHLKKAVLINVRGTREALNLGEACKHLKAFIYISTAYTGANHNNDGKTIEEKFHPTPIDPDILIHFVEAYDEMRISEMTPILAKDFPNTYTFTKRVAEEMVHLREGKMPIAVIRPGIVIAAAAEPVPGWIDMRAMMSASGIKLGYGLGVIHAACFNNEKRPAYIPVDFVNNATIISAFNINNRWNGGQKDVQIYSVVGSGNHITVGQHQEIFKEVGPQMPTEKVVFYQFFAVTKYKFLYLLLCGIFHFIPGAIIDFVLLLLGKRPMLTKVYTKLHKMSDVLFYFWMHDWDFRDNNLVGMFKSMSPRDRIIYNCTNENLNWKTYITLWIIGGRKYIIKDGLQHTNYAKKKLIALFFLHYLITPLYLYSFIYIFTWKFSIYIYFFTVAGLYICSDISNFVGIFFKKLFNKLM